MACSPKSAAKSSSPANRGFTSPVSLAATFQPPALLNMADDSDSEETTVNAISLKFPPFWPQDPVLWFARVEAMFHT